MRTERISTHNRISLLQSSQQRRGFAIAHSDLKREDTGKERIVILGSGWAGEHSVSLKKPMSDPLQDMYCLNV
jgi:hypothetical protein